MNRKIKVEIKLIDKGKNKVVYAQIICFAFCMAPLSPSPLCLSLPLFKPVCAAAHTDAVVNRCANGIKGTIH